MQRLVLFILVLAFRQDYKQYLDFSYEEIDSFIDVEYNKSFVSHYQMSATARPHI